ncbi:hypothetical protein FRC07_001428 [Ceratobasidium sp. 392]|nr:hypothetical protein FRC07_001428 [Ceratobasidium sp. 392]
MREYIPWLNRFNELCVTSENDKTLDNTADGLSGAMEIASLGYITANINTGYSLMRRMSPTFMHIAFADPSLWPRDPSSSGLSLAHVLVSPQYKLGRFVFSDALTSFTFGVPPLIEFNTSHPVFRTSEAHPMEWVHGCPVEFIFWIAKINAWRAQSPHDCEDLDSVWKDIESATWAWRPRYNHGKGAHESWKTIARFATQEGWRHVGMCGVDNHDLRVQSSMQQIGRLQRMMKDDLGVDMHFVVPLLVAAICTRSKAEQSQFYSAITRFGDNKPWLFKGFKFALVLDHLWHGAAANGAPITWNNYVNSRKKIIYIDA